MPRDGGERSEEGKDLSGRKGRSGKGDPPAGGPMSDVAAAEYLSEILPELVRVADRGGLDIVAYLLEMARVETTNTALRGASRERG